MSLPPPLRDRLRLPVIGAPMFIVSGPELVLAQCAAGIVGSFPALNARPYEMLDIWLMRISKELSEIRARHPDAPPAPFAVLAYICTRFIATEEANAPAEHKQMIVDSSASDIVYTNLFTGVHGNYLKGSIVNAGLDPDNLPESDKSKMDFSSGSAKAKAWRDIWGAGQGVGQVQGAPPTAEVIAQLEREYSAMRVVLD